MPDYVVTHFHNAADRAAEKLSRAIAGPHLDAVRRMRGFTNLQRFELADRQLMPTIAQPWRHLSIYEFTLDAPELHLPALASHLADLRDAGLIAADGTERIYSYRMFSPWKYSANFIPGQPLTHLMVLLANFTPGREAEYHDWYDRVHSVEVSESPGYVGMKRGELSGVRIPPIHYCPGSQLIMGGLQTDDLAFAVEDFAARAGGTSESGIAWGERSTAASQARTVHLFKSLDGPFEAMR